MVRIRSFLSLCLFAFSLCACDGPWNMSPPDADDPVSLQVSLLLVSGRRFDTLRVQAPLPMDGKALPPGWLDTTRSSAVLRRQGATDSVVYRPLAADPTLWVPVARAVPVRAGETWNLALDVSWREGAAARRDTIRGMARVPSGCGIEGDVRVPSPLRDGVLASDPRAAVAGLEASARDSLRAGLLPWRTLRTGDTLWFPHSTEPFPDPHGVSVPLAFQRLSFDLRRDTALWGGAWAEMEFGASARRIVSARARREEGDDAEDPEELKVIGRRKALESKLAERDKSQPEWPASWGLEADLFDRTGPVVLRVFLPEPGLLEWRRGLRSTRGANGLLRPKLTGAQGFGAGACVDSLAFTVRATRDTL